MRLWQLDKVNTVELSLACCCNREDCDETFCQEYAEIIVNGNSTVLNWLTTFPLTVIGISGDIRIVLRKGQRLLAYLHGTWSNNNLTGLLEAQNLDGSPASGTASLGGVAVLTVSGGGTATVVVTVTGTYDGDPVSVSYTWTKEEGFQYLCTNKVPAPIESGNKYVCTGPVLSGGTCLACAVNPNPATYKITLNLTQVLEDVTFPESYPFGKWMDCYQYYNREFLVYQESGCKWKSNEIQRPLSRGWWLDNSSRCPPDAGGVDPLPRVQLDALVDFVDDVQVLQWRVTVRFGGNLLPPIGIPGYPVNIVIYLFAVVEDRDCTATVTATGEAGSAIIEVLT